MNGWKDCTLCDVLVLGNGKSRPMDEGAIPVYGGNGILDYCNSFNYSGETVIIGRVGAYCGSTYYVHEKVWISDNALAAKAKYTTDAKFIYYLLLNLDLNQYAEGSSHPLLTHSLLYSIKTKLPKKENEQKAIAAVLSSLDNKIDLLHRQNATLEAMAEALFRQWFVVEAKEEWEDITVANIADINKQSIGKGYPYHEIQYLDTGSLTEGRVDNYQQYPLSSAPSRAQRLVKHNDILISLVRPNQKHYGIIKNPASNVVVSTGFCVLTCKDITPYFLYIFLTTKDMTESLHSIAEGSTSAYPALKPSDIAGLELKRPPADRLIEFSKYTDSAWSKIAHNQTQIRTLEKLRDTLLPKLMSGEVRVEF